MDNLARNAMLAKQAGMSYGQWKALQPRVDPAKPKKSEWERVCPWCGKTFIKKDHRTQTYCEFFCREEAQKERDRQRKKAEYEKRKEQNNDK